LIGNGVINATRTEVVIAHYDRIHSHVGIGDYISSIDIEYRETARILSYHAIGFSAALLHEAEPRTDGRLNERLARLNFSGGVEADSEPVVGHDDEVRVVDRAPYVQKVIAFRPRVEVKRESALHLSSPVHEVRTAVAADRDEIIRSEERRVGKGCRSGRLA